MRTWIFRALALVALMLSPMVGQAADPKQPTDAKKVVPASHNAPVITSTGQSCASGNCGTPDATAYEGEAPAKKGGWFKRLKGSGECGQCERGCDSRLHCSCFKQEFDFMFGGCRSFFSNERCAPARGYVQPPTGPCEYGTFHRY